MEKLNEKNPLCLFIVCTVGKIISTLFQSVWLQCIFLMAWKIKVLAVFEFLNFMAWSWEFWKVMYPCYFLERRKIQGYIIFQVSQFYGLELRIFEKLCILVIFWLLKSAKIPKKFPKTYVSLYFPCLLYKCKNNTRIHKFSFFGTFWKFFWNLTYPCNFLAFYMSVRKLQGYVTFGEILHILVISLPYICV